MEDPLRRRHRSKIIIARKNRVILILRNQHDREQMSAEIRVSAFLIHNLQVISCVIQLQKRSFEMTGPCRRYRHGVVLRRNRPGTVSILCIQIISPGGNRSGGLGLRRRRLHTRQGSAGDDILQRISQRIAQIRDLPLREHVQGTVRRSPDITGILDVIALNGITVHNLLQLLIADRLAHRSLGNRQIRPHLLHILCILIEEPLSGIQIKPAYDHIRNTLLSPGIDIVKPFILRIRQHIAALDPQRQLDIVQHAGIGIPGLGCPFLIEKA